MRNHWHFVLWPREEGEVTAFMRWLAHTHAMRWHVAHGTVGQGHLYQGRFKSFPIEEDEHFLTVCRYVERNALTAHVVDRAEDWRWSSLWARRRGDEQLKAILSDWPVERPMGWMKLVNEPMTEKEVEGVRTCIAKPTLWKRGVARETSETPRFGSHAAPRRPAHGDKSDAASDKLAASPQFPPATSDLPLFHEKISRCEHCCVWPRRSCTYFCRQIRFQRESRFRSASPACGCSHGVGREAVGGVAREKAGYELKPDGKLVVDISAETRQPQANGNVGPAESCRLVASKGRVSIVGADPAGAMYGCIEIAQEVQRTGRLPDELNRCDGPKIALRGTCVLLMKLGNYNLPVAPKEFPFFYDRRLWIEYLDFLAENRSTTSPSGTAIPSITS